VKSKNNKKHRRAKLTVFWYRFCKNKLAVFGFIFLCILTFAAILANVIAPYGYDEQNVLVALTGPCKKYIMGTDYLGRDIFSRMLYGARVSLSIGVLSTIVGTTLGVTIGLIAGYYGGRVENVIMRRSL
jgi:ABC-type dipeptide/oligopeptide/nickel transport system permease subunit